MTAPVCKATGLKTVEAARICQALVIAGVPFEFSPAHLEASQTCAVTVPLKHRPTLDALMKPPAPTKIPTVGTGATA